MDYYPRLQEFVQQYGDDPMFAQILQAVIGRGTNEPSSVERSLGGLAAGGPQEGAIGSEFNRPRSGGRFGEEYSLPKGSNVPRGAYAMAKFPGIEHQIWAQESGFLPKGYHWSSYLNETPEEKLKREKAQKEWAMRQKQMLGMDTGPAPPSWRRR
jgi:hypothetical protein